MIVESRASPPGWTGETPVAPSHDASRCHRTQYLYQNRVLFRKQGAQINHDTALFDAGDYRRSAGAETGAEFVGAEIDMAKRDQPGGQYGRWGRATPDHGFSLAQCHLQLRGLHLRTLNPGDDRFRAARNLVFRQRSEEHTSELQSPVHLVCRLLLEKK